MGARVQFDRSRREPELCVFDGTRSQSGQGRASKLKVWDPVLETLAERGAAQEQAFVSTT